MKLLHIASVATVLAGLSHLTLQAYSHFGMHFYFVSFLAVGFVQILLGILLWKGKLTQELFWVTTLINGGATIFWLLTRLMVAPFMGGVEHFSTIGIAVIFLQVVCIVCLCLEQKKLINFILVIIGSVGLGFGSHIGAMQLEQSFPELKVTGGHHATMSAEDHAKMMNMPTDPAQAESNEEHDHTECGEAACPIPTGNTQATNNQEVIRDTHQDEHGNAPH